MARFLTPVLAAVFGVCVATALTIGVRAEGLVTTQKLSAPLANELVGDAVASCAQKGYAVTAAVVDLDGVRQAILRGGWGADPYIGQRVLQGLLGSIFVTEPSSAAS